MASGDSYGETLVKHFASLYARIDSTRRRTEKIKALADYFAAAAPGDGAWAVHFLSGERLKGALPRKVLRDVCLELAGIPDWLMGECYEAVGDLAETYALTLPKAAISQEAGLAERVDGLRRLRDLSETEQRAQVKELLRSCEGLERFLVLKLLTGALRVGVSKKLVIEGLASAFSVPAEAVAHRLMGDWAPSPLNFASLVAQDDGEAITSQPYPFFLAHAVEGSPGELGPRDDWQAEWKWDGIRAQAIRRDAESFIWTRGEELATDRFPELHPFLASLPDGSVLDGEIVAYRDGKVLPFSSMQRRIARKKLGPKILRDVPVHFIAFDILESANKDVRSEPLARRRELLTGLLSGATSSSRVSASEALPTTNWGDLARCRERCRDEGTEGLMLKRLSSPYRSGRPKGDWWKWKVDPYSVDAVLVYAQKGSGRRAGLFSDYTFALWEDDELVPFAKAYSGLTDDEMAAVDKFVKANTVERFGPVRRVEPRLVFEIGFDSIGISTRHKSGVAVRFPRMLRWRKDKSAASADTLEMAKSLLPSSN